MPVLGSASPLYLAATNGRRTTSRRRRTAQEPALLLSPSLVTQGAGQGGRGRAEGRGGAQGATHLTPPCLSSSLPPRRSGCGVL